MNPANDITRHGYATVENFLSEAEARVLLDEFESASLSSAKNYPVKYLSKNLLARFSEKLLPLAKSIGAESQVRTDRVTVGIFFSTRLGGDFDWHQDHDSVYVHQATSNYLNFYIPLRKPRRDRSGLSLVSASAFEKHAPDIWKRRVGRGACHARRVGENTVFVDNFSRIRSPRDHQVAHFALDEIATTPQLRARDLLILRGDIFHKTQDAETDRVAVSFRFQCSGDPVIRDGFVAKNLNHLLYMTCSPERYRRRLWAFDENRSDTLTLAQYEETYQRLQTQPVPGRYQAHWSRESLTEGFCGLAREGLSARALVFLKVPHPAELEAVRRAAPHYDVPAVIVDERAMPDGSDRIMKLLGFSDRSALLPTNDLSRELDTLADHGFRRVTVDTDWAGSPVSSWQDPEPVAFVIE